MTAPLVEGQPAEQRIQDPVLHPARNPGINQLVRGPVDGIEPEPLHLALPFLDAPAAVEPVRAHERPERAPQDDLGVCLEFLLAHGDEEDPVGRGAAEIDFLAAGDVAEIVRGK